MRFPTLLFLGFFCVVVIVCAQESATTDAEQKKAFLKAREQMRVVPLATPPPPAPDTPKPAPAEETPKPKPKPAPQPLTPKPRPKAEPDEKRGPVLLITPKPRAPSATAAPGYQRSIPAPVTVEKSGFEDAEVVPAEKEEKTGWSWFGSSAKYKYLTRSVRDAIDDAPVRRNRWRYIIVHNSGTRQGSAKAFHYYHLRVRKMPNGMAYHFVIGNGSSTADGQVEIGSRWTRQINGGHVHSDYMNNIGLGICLVGDYNRDTPTQKQRESLEELIKYLRKRVGKIEGKPSRVEPHRNVNPPRWATDCPGDKFPYSWLRGFN